MNRSPELVSETFTRWAKAVWPNLVGVFGLVLIGADALFLPPPGISTTSGVGVLLLGATGFVNLNRAEKKADRDDDE